MGRAKTKQELQTAAEGNYEKLMDMIDSMLEVDQEKEFTFDVTNEKEAHWKRDKNIRDVLIHLYEWHQLFINWVNNNTKGNTSPFLIEGYNWKTYGDMNVEFRNKHQNTSYSDSKKMLEDSHKEVMKIIDEFSNEDLFEKGRLAWTGGSTLGSYGVSVTAGHYDWAMKKIKKHISTIAQEK